MMKYERLTFRHKSVVDGMEQIGYTEKLVGCYRKEEMILNRLAELEDKIEQGTLIEQKNGKWINLPDYGGGGWKMVGSDEAVQPKHCSICGDVYVKEYKYCPSCGAKMKD